MKLRNMYPLSGVLLLLTLFGCTNALHLIYAKPAAVPPSKREISVIVSDKRGADYGGNTPNVVGIARNTFGMPFPIKAAPGREPPMKFVRDYRNQYVVQGQIGRLTIGRSLQGDPGKSYKVKGSTFDFCLLASHYGRLQWPKQW